MNDFGYSLKITRVSLGLGRLGQPPPPTLHNKQKEKLDAKFN